MSHICILSKKELSRILRNFQQLSLFILTTFILSGCVKSCQKIKDIPPEDQLYKYISTAVNVTKAEQRQELIELTTGQLKSALVNASEESFKKAYLDRRYDFKTFEVLERKDLPEQKQVQIDFKLVYKSWLPGEYPEKLPMVEITNRATMTYEYGRWAISEVSSLSTHFEWQEGLPTRVNTSGVDENTPPADISSTRSPAEDMTSDGASAVKSKAQP